MHLYLWCIDFMMDEDKGHPALLMMRLHLLCIALVILFLGVLHAGERHIQAVRWSDDCCPRFRHDFSVQAFS